MERSIERLAFNFDTLAVKRGDDKVPHLMGHAAVFNQVAQVSSWFKARVEPGAFSKSIERDDIRALFNHDSNIVLGRKSKGSLVLKEDEHGLAVDITPPDTQLVRDMVLSPIERGDISQMSIGFIVLNEQWDETGEMPLWILHEVELFEVSPVTFPAFPQTDIGVKSFAAYQSLKAKGMNRLSAAPVIRRDLRQRARRHV